MLSPKLTPSQTALSQAMHQTVTLSIYKNYFQATFVQALAPSIVFFRYDGGDVLMIRGALIDFLALVQHGDITITHHGLTAYSGSLTQPLSPA